MREAVGQLDGESEWLLHVVALLVVDEDRPVEDVTLGVVDLVSPPRAAPPLGQEVEDRDCVTEGVLDPEGLGCPEALAGIPVVDTLGDRVPTASVLLTLPVLVEETLRVGVTLGLEETLGENVALREALGDVLTDGVVDPVGD